MKLVTINGKETSLTMDNNGDIYRWGKKVPFLNNKTREEYPSIRIFSSISGVRGYARVDRLVYENLLGGVYDDEIPIFHKDNNEFNYYPNNIHVGFMIDENYPNEIWKKYQIVYKTNRGIVYKTLPTKYWVSSYGRVYSTKYWKFMISDHSDRYELSEKSQGVWRESFNKIDIIAETFIPNPFNKPYAVLIDPSLPIRLDNITWSYYEYISDYDQNICDLDDDIKILTSGSNNEMNNMWKQVIVDNIPTSYIVSKLGKVYNTKTRHLMNPRIAENGYLRINLSIPEHPNRRKGKAIHVLVAEAFIPNPENKAEVNHKNGRKKDNTIDNLEWMTHEENIQHAIDHGWIKCNDPLARAILFRHD